MKEVTVPQQQHYIFIHAPDPFNSLADTLLSISTPDYEKKEAWNNVIQASFQ
jgi:hypothetical protein